MPKFERTTRSCSFSEMRPEAVAAIRKHIEKHVLGDLESTILQCCETISTKQKKGFFSSKTVTIITSVMLTREWLVWAAWSNGDSPAVVHARLRDIRIQDYEATDMFSLVNDTGLNILGPLSDTIQPSSIFIGFGTGADADTFRKSVKEAVDAAGQIA